ncbi:tetratricopeptide repeat protein [Leptolyngbya sp. KIOST-1]|uniref:tetratricopeptide repeat protein n=1 Tax=Leptolyngbya sp. KIOST-1 TaxID=1229172 RepID=UPI0021F14DBC|nr:tetratricopeptide repeat protein [Leptolyngbya sp. KIOST-1]
MGEWRDRGLIQYQQGQLTDAQRDLERYLYEHPDAPDGFEIRQVIEQIERVQDEP